MNVYQIIDGLLDKYLKKNEELTEAKRDYRNEIITIVYKWYERVEAYMKENAEADLKDYHDRHGR